MNVGTLHKVKRYPKDGHAYGKDVLYIGIDLGTFRSVMVSSDSHEVEELICWHAQRPYRSQLLKRDVLFGNEALNRLALNLYRPLELGVIKEHVEDREFIAHFITHLIGLSDPRNTTVSAAIGAPAEASHVDKTAIFDVTRLRQLKPDASRTAAVAYALDTIPIPSSLTLAPEPLTCAAPTAPSRPRRPNAHRLRR